MTAFEVEETLLEGTWTVVIHRDDELVGVGQGATVEAARMVAINDMQISDFIEFERQNHRREFWMGMTFGAVLIIMVVLLAIWQVLT